MELDLKHVIYEAISIEWGLFLPGHLFVFVEIFNERSNGRHFVDVTTKISWRICLHDRYAIWHRMYSQIYE